MWKQALPLLMIFSSINQSSSGTMWEIEYHRIFTINYFTWMKAGIYRGILFSYSAAQKRKLCEDYFSRQLYVETQVEDIESDARDEALVTDSRGETQFPLTVNKFRLAADGRGTRLGSPELFCTCVGRFVKRKPFLFDRVHISRTLNSGFWYVTTRVEGSKHFSMVPFAYMASSPEYVKLEQKQVEEKYMKVRQRIEALRKESAEYIQLVEERDDLSALSEDQKLHLCDSILSSAIFRVDRLEFHLNFSRMSESDLEYKRQPLAFANKNYAPQELMTADCICCTGYKDSQAPSLGSTTLYFTRSYDVYDSLFVLKWTKEGIYFDKYFKKIPTLTNAFMTKTKITLKQNYDL